MVKSNVHKTLALLAAAVLCGLTACGDKTKSPGSTSPVSSNASTIPVSGHLIGDYDNDDGTESHYGDADNDDTGGPIRDRDNDEDNSSGSYYDADDKAVRDLGRAADAIDRRAIVATVKRYYQAVEAEDGANGCSMIASNIADAVPEGLGGSSGPADVRGDTCAVVMSKFYKANHQQLGAYAAKLEVTGVRLTGVRGVAILGFRTLPGRQIAVTREDGVWKINGVIDTELP